MALNVDRSLQGIRVKDLSFAYPGATQVLSNVSFTVEAGERVLLAGATGSGKSTLLRCLKPELTAHGVLEGEVRIDGLRTQEFNAQLSAGSIGFVMQDPYQQIVMDTVKAELAFGLENLGVAPELIQRRVAEIANYFGINAWVDRSTSELSGGETQIVNLAAIIAMQPRTLLLDEPTSALDPIAAREFIELVQRVNDELGITVILVEHQQEDLLGSMNQVLYLEDGRLAFNGRPKEFAQWMHETQNLNQRALPVSARLFLSQQHPKGNGALMSSSTEDIPLDVREGRWWLWQHREEATPVLQRPVSPEDAASMASSPGCGGKTAGDTVLEARHVWYRYNKEDAYVLKDLSLCVHKARVLGIVGANASGKSTLLSLLTGTAKPQHGKMLKAAELQLGLLPQDPTTLFLRDTLLEDLMDHAGDFAYGEAEVTLALGNMGLLEKKERHPLDLSGGEQQKLALAKILLTNPDILLMDEPTTGLDSLALGSLNTIIRRQCAQGKTIVMVSHDLEFVAATADECLMLFDGGVVGRAPTRDFFMGNMFYTTALQRITQGIVEDCPPVLGWQDAPETPLQKEGGTA